MAVIEQILYGDIQESSTNGGVVLAQSSGLSQGCVSEIVRLCDRWGMEKLTTISRPVLISYPLQARLPTLPGKLYSVIQFTSMPEPLFHAVVLTESDYSDFDFNPFTLALEDVFVREWTAELRLDRQQVDSDTLAPLFSQLPTERDADMIDEALRLLFAEKKLLLPLELNDAESDRFLTMLVAALPISIKRELRFASLAPSEDNQYVLAANFQLGSTCQNWYRILMASMSGPISKDLASYLDEVKRLLIASDFHGLENLSRKDVALVDSKSKGKRKQAKSSLHGKSRGGIAKVSPVGTRPARTPTLASAVSSAVTAAANTLPESASRLAAGARRMGWKSESKTRTRLRPSDRSRSRRYRTRRRVPVKFALVLLASMSLAGAGYWLSIGGWTRMGTWFDEGVNLRTKSSLLGVVDVSAIYESQLHDVVKTGPDTSGKEQAKRSAKAMKELKFGAAEDLNQQSRLMVDLVEQGIHPNSAPNREIERMNSLADRGEVLEQDLKRLTLSYFSFSHGVLWRDLAKLDERKMTARYDSLRKHEPENLQLVSEELGLSGQISEVRYAQRKAAGMAEMVQAFEQKHMDPQWPAKVEKAAKALDTNSMSPTLAAYRACALALARLKRAETATHFSDLAFERDFVGQGWLPGRVREHLAGLRARVDRYGPDIVPTLALATVECYDTLLSSNLDWQTSSPDQYAGVIKRLAGNAAVKFDPETYKLHVDRLRIVALESLLSQQYESNALPDEFFPGEDREAALKFLSLKQSQPSRNEWRMIGSQATQPYYTHWAYAEAKYAERRNLQQKVEFDRRYKHLANTAQQLEHQVRRGQDWLVERDQLLAKVSEFQDQYAIRFLADTHRRGKLDRLPALVTALNQPLKLALTSVTVRISHAMLEQSTEVALTLMDENGNQVQTTPAFAVGPAAPEGTGWVGTQPISMDVILRPGQTMQAKVQRVADGAILLKVDYGSASDPLPRALTVSQPGSRPGGDGGMDQGEAGTILFKMTDSYWRQLDLPDL